MQTSNVYPKLPKVTKLKCRENCHSEFAKFKCRGSLRGTNILTTKLMLRKVSNYYIFKTKAPTATPFPDICSIEESFHILESRPYLTSHVISTEKTLKLKRHIVLDNKISINTNRATIYIM